MPLHKNVRIHDAAFANQVKNVLRLEVGSMIIVADGVQHEAEAQITGYEKDTVELTIGEIVKNQAEPERRVTLYLSMLKNGNFELAVQKAVECGVTDIVPITADRTIKIRLNSARVKRIIREAAEQSGRSSEPKLHDAKTLSDAIVYATNNNINIVFHPKGIPFVQCTDQLISSDSVGVFIGPEGGWSDDEREYFEHRAKGDSKLLITRLGSQILRAETAAIVGTYLAVHAGKQTNPGEISNHGSETL